LVRLGELTRRMVYKLMLGLLPSVGDLLLGINFLEVLYFRVKSFWTMVGEWKNRWEDGFTFRLLKNP